MLAVVAIAALLTIIAHHRALARAIPRAPRGESRLERYPSLTIIRPVRGLDVGAADNARALVASDYPGELEILFVFDDRDDPAFPVIRDAIFGSNARILICGEPPPGRTGKLHAMIFGAALARGELIGFSDSDTRLSPELLRHGVETLLTTPDAADVFVPVVVANRPQRAGDVAYALLQNSWYGPSVARVAGPSGELPFIMGQLMIWKRAALDAIGGLACAQGQLVDDMYLGKRVAAAGMRNVMTRDRLPIPCSGMSIFEFTAIFRRWLLFSRNGLPAGFTVPNWLRGIEYWLALICLALALRSGEWVTAAIALVAAALSVASQIRLERLFGGVRIPPRWWWVPATLPLIAPLLVLSAMLHHEVDWRGRPYQLGTRARLAS